MALEDDGPIRPGTRAWYEARGETYPDAVVAWLHHEMYMELAMREHVFDYGVPYGPTLRHVQDYKLAEDVKKIFNASEPKINYDELEKKVRSAIHPWAPGIPCGKCTSEITATFVQGRIIYRPFGRPHHHQRRIDDDSHADTGSG